MTSNIILALIIGCVAFLVLVTIWYFAVVPAKRKQLAQEANDAAEKEAEKEKRRQQVQPRFPLLRFFIHDASPRRGIDLLLQNNGVPETGTDRPDRDTECGHRRYTDPADHARPNGSLF